MTRQELITLCEKFLGERGDATLCCEILSSFDKANLCCEILSSFHQLNSQNSFKFKKHFQNRRDSSPYILQVLGRPSAYASFHESFVRFVLGELIFEEKIESNSKNKEWLPVTEDYYDGKTFLLWNDTDIWKIILRGYQIFDVQLHGLTLGTCLLYSDKNHNIRALQNSGVVGYINEEMELRVNTDPTVAESLKKLKHRHDLTEEKEKLSARIAEIDAELTKL